MISFATYAVSEFAEIGGMAAGGNGNRVVGTSLFPNCVSGVSAFETDWIY
jgi:hypothetical protein